MLCMGTAGIYFCFLLLYRVEEIFKLKEISLFDITNHMYAITIPTYVIWKMIIFLPFRYAILHHHLLSILGLMCYYADEKNVADRIQNHMTEKMHYCGGKKSK